ncbi:ESX-1 secretion-associated protein [Mycolicibacterium duvalii]|uniref:Uncharacterized protein n=1 Tax=Mycolicibacterium duvalii TaxID=39688 RepID=A0A7I7K5M2_9MYCO|nr:type VII secretion target [Mycolicibacterium duvalii]MCV7370713.1 ESX-1 secretion-associated protein [Mycolicibacterium duvalii]PEG36103.1 ESX-1 secretion-associated protein [Mycolicibacterium duvalii]BBX19333.1 hypothetical protein MDUV_41930 [Mycolicibacterium duvalii]
MGGRLRVNTDELRTVGGAFAAAADRLAASQPDAPLGDAAAAVPALQTASACQNARDTVATQVSALVSGARGYGAKLHDAAAQYEQTDTRSGEQIRGVDIPPPASR